jgi:N utilization substance protein B
MNARHRAREVALQILYRYDVALQAKQTIPPMGAALARDLEYHFSHFVVPEALREFAALLVVGTLAQMTELDSLLEHHASNWKISRMGLVDRNLLRMAAYELLQVPETPPTVVIDEAIELGKQFGTSDTPGFVNGILDAIRGSLPSKAAGG